MTRTVRLGYAVGSGQPVDIPVRNMCVSGQTQEAGKTTALEALIARSGLRAITFITKRGESSFTSARRIDPYFREQADWQFVASILEASRGEKLKFERAWIIRASKGARTLADVQRNVRKAMETAKGMSADVYLTLDAYLESVVPAIAAVRWAPAVQLAPGVNVMDLTRIPIEMQHLVIKSSLDWVLEREQDTVVVVPEAWKFIPEGRGTPVKHSADALIRQGSGIKNYVWLDSQDIGGVAKTILRHVPVWILGVQREANEIKRTLDNIPAGIAKPSKADIATLELGQFFACWGKQAIRTYVQPAWLDADEARSVAMGVLAVGSLKGSRQFMIGGADQVRKFAEAFEAAACREEPVTNEEAARLTRENERLIAENADLRRRLDALEERSHETTQLARAAARDAPASRQSPNGDDGPVRRQHAVRDESTPGGSSARAARTFTAEESFETEALYQAFKARLTEELPKDPSVMRIVISRPELMVEVQRHIVTVDGDSTRGRIARLIDEGWFAKSRTSADVLSELEKRGRKPSNIELGNEMKALTEMGFFRRDNKWFSLVADMKVNVVERELTGADR